MPIVVVVGIVVAVVLFVAFPRQMGLLAAVFIVGIGALGIYLWAEAQQAANTRSAVTAEAQLAPALCPDPKAPVAIAFTNGNPTTVDAIGFVLEARREGHSGLVYSDFLSSDKIIAPGERSSACWPLSRPLKDVAGAGLVFTVRVNSVQLHQDGS
ncbi:MAG TPA: hypothetical protein VGM83_18865 [Devosiaceae bacterium]|jgi:hypothetical protein